MTRAQYLRYMSYAPLYIIEPVVELCLFKPIGKKHVLPILMCNLPAFGSVSQFFTKEGKVK